MSDWDYSWSAPTLIHLSARIRLVVCYQHLLYHAQQRTGPADHSALPWS